MKQKILKADADNHRYEEVVISKIRQKIDLWNKLCIGALLEKVGLKN